MIAMDISSQLVPEFFVRFPTLQAACKQSVLHLRTERVSLQGQSTLASESASWTGAKDKQTQGLVLTSDNRVIVYGGRRNMIGSWEWISYEEDRLDEVEFRYVVNLDGPRISIECKFLRKPTSCEALINPLIETEFATVVKAPGFPETFKWQNTTFQTSPAEVQITEFPYQSQPTVRAFVGTTSESKIVRYWNASKLVEREFPNRSLVGTVSRNGSRYLVWVDHAKVSCVSFDTQAERFLGGPAEPLANVPELPVPVRYRGQVSGLPLASSTGICFGDKDSGRIHLVGAERATYVLEKQQSRQAYCFENTLVIADIGALHCLELNPVTVTNTPLAESLGVPANEYPETESQFIAHTVSCYSPTHTTEKTVTLLQLTDRHLKSLIGPITFDVIVKDLTHVTACEYLFAPQKSDMHKLLLWDRDTERFRKAVLHNQLLCSVSSDGGIRNLYAILNQQQVRKSSSLLFADLLLLIQKMHEVQHPDRLIESMTLLGDSANVPKQLCTDVLAKVILLAEALPLLKRNFELIGSNYPYQLNARDEQWLCGIYGDQIARHVSKLQEELNVRSLRQFVQGVQSGMWRAFGEIERSLTRMEPLYVERVRKTRSVATRSAIVAPAVGIVASVGGAFLFQNPVLVLGAVTSGVSLAGSITNSWTGDKANQSLLMEQGMELLEWWNVFVNSFSVQAYESDRFLSKYFDDKANRDAVLFKSMPESKRKEMLTIVRSQLVKRIEIESQERLENLWDGSTLLRQDLMELQESLSKNRMRLRIGTI